MSKYWVRIPNRQAIRPKSLVKNILRQSVEDRPEYVKMASELRKGDVIVVWWIDRLGRSTYELIKLMVEWKEMGVHFRSISEGIDTSTKMGRLWYMLRFC